MIIDKVLPGLYYAADLAMRLSCRSRQASMDYTMSR